MRRRSFRRSETTNDEIDPCVQSESKWKKYCFKLLYIAIIAVVSALITKIIMERHFYSQELNKIIRDEIQRFDDDKTGRADYALESAGGSIVSIRDTNTYAHKEYYLFGFKVCNVGNKPQVILKSFNQVGECWAFKGSTGRVVIQLLGRVHVDAVSLEHISPNVAPTRKIASAPKDFTVLGLSSPKDNGGTVLGNFCYDINGPSLQTFEIYSENGSKYIFNYIELIVNSNHGNEDFTCIYRFRVHGQLA